MIVSGVAGRSGRHRRIEATDPTGMARPGPTAPRPNDAIAAAVAVALSVALPPAAYAIATAGSVTAAGLALMVLAGLVLAATSYVALRAVPQRAMERVNETLRQREASLALANSVLTAATEGAPDAILIVKSDGTLVSYNERFLEVWQIPREALASGTDAKALDLAAEKVKDRNAFLERVRYLYAHPEETSHDVIELLGDRYLDRFSRTLHTPEGQVIGRIWFFRDVTNPKRAERRVQEELQRTQRQLGAIAEIGRAEGLISGDVEAIARQATELGARTVDCERVNVWLFDAAETELRCIDLYERTPARHSSGMVLSEKEFGRELAIIKTSKFVDASEPLSDPRTAGYVEPYLKPLNITAMLDVSIEASGRHFGLLCFEHVGQPHQWTSDEIAFALQLADKVGFAIVSRQRREAEEAIKHSEEKYRNLVESTTDFIWELDADARFTYVSPAFKRLLGYEADDLLGKTPFELMRPEEGRRVAAFFAPIEAERKPFALFENSLLRKDGTELTIEVSGTPIFGRDGAFLGYRGIDRDVSQRKAAELELRRRDTLLDAIVVSAAELVSAPSIEDAVSTALQRVGEALGIDRSSVLDRPPVQGAPPILRFTWQKPDVQTALDRSVFDRLGFKSAEIVAWQAPLWEGRYITADRSTARGDVEKLLDGVGGHSLLIVPVMIDGKYWGQMSFESCNRKREWATYEIEVLRLMANLVGNAIQRERFVRELANANRIVLNTPTILYRMRGEPSFPLSYISQNVKLLGHEPKVLLASPNLYQQLVHPDDIAAVREAMANVLDNHAPQGVIEFRVLTGDGDYRWMESRYTPVRDQGGRLIEVEGLMIDVTERKAAEEKIAQLARTDPLTGLANRATFNDRLQQAFFAARRGASPFAVFYIDLDRFKDINDTLGHPIGDRLLIEIAERLTSAIRDTDVVARIGGDEFAVMQTALINSADAGTLAAKLQAALKNPIFIAGNEIRITISIGIAVYAADTGAPEDLMAQADVALYRAKEEGRNQYRFHTADLDREVREDVAIAEEIRLAKERDEFELYYQPQIELKTNRIVGMEALLRWNHPRRGLLAPPDFIALAERTGAIVQIGEWTLDRACRQMSEWRSQGIAPQTIAINVSPVQIKTAGEFVSLVIETLARWGLEPEALELDVTESMLARAALTQNDALEKLQDAGVKIAIDDFGTRYSSLDYLRTYNVSRIKIPQNLLEQAIHDPAGAAMVRAIVGIAREFELDVVAQGVETEEQWSFLTTTSPAGRVQGYYYSRPVPAHDAKALLERGRLMAVAKMP